MIRRKMVTLAVLWPSSLTSIKPQVLGCRMGVLIPFSSELVSLGVTLDSKLTWKPEVDQVTKKVNKDLYSLRFIRACTTVTLRKRLVESLVQPHRADFCTVVYLDATNEQRTRLDQLSNTGVRYIFVVRRHTHIAPYWRRLGWLRSDSRRLYFTALLLYKIRRMREPTYLADLFKEHNPRPTSRGIQPELTFPAVMLCLVCMRRVRDRFKFRLRASATLFPPAPHSII